MPFDVDKFEKSKFQYRTQLVDVSGSPLASFFDEGEDPQFKVRNLTGEEMALCNEAQNKTQKLREAMEALAGNSKEERVKALQEAMGFTSNDDIPADLARRIEAMRLGCMEPELTEQQAVKLMRVSCVQGYKISNSIFDLSGEGMELGEPNASGGTQG